MATLAERSVGAVERRLSRRGFLATCGKLTLGLGMAMLGISHSTRMVFGACCPGPSCDSAHTHPCPHSLPYCPPGCSTLRYTDCCDAGTLHRCFECYCAGVTCYCEETLGIDC